MSLTATPESSAGPSEHTGDRLVWLVRIKAFAIAWIILNHVVERIAGSPYIGNPNATWPPLSERIAQLTPVEGPPLLSPLLNLVRWLGWFGDQGVQLFLIASGFGIVWSVVHRVGEGGAVEMRPFVSRRFGRIYPEWWVAHAGLALIAVVGVAAFGRVPGLDFGPWDWRFWASLAGFRMTPETIYYGSPSWWYIGLMLQLYLVFPLLWGMLRRWGPARFLATVLPVAIAIRLAGLLAFDSYLDAWSRGAIFITRLPEFAVGMALAVWWARDQEGVPRILRRRSTVMAGSALWLTGTVLSLTLVGNAVSPVMLGVGVCAIAAPLLLRPAGPHGVVSWLSDHSYSLFLTHHPPIRILLAGPVLAVGGFVVGAAVVAALVAGVVGAIALERTTGWLTDRSGGGRRWKRRVGAGFAALAVAGVVVVAAEMAVQRWSPQEALGWGERPALQADERFGWTLRPDTTTRLRWLDYDYTVEANDLGFPGPEPVAEGTPGAIRVMTFGDAFTSAEGVDTPLAWPRLLEESAREADLEIEVLNFATTGYGPQHHAAVAREFVPRFEPDVVIVQAYVNDFADVTRTDEQFADSIGFGRPEPFGWQATLQLAHLRRWLDQNVRAPLLAVLRDRKGPGYGLGDFRALERDSIDAASPEYAEVSARLGEVTNLARQVGADVHLVMVPAAPQVCGRPDLAYYPRNTDLTDPARYDLELPQRLMAGIASDLGVTFHDLRPVLSGGECVYQPANKHWLESGHRRVADYVESILR